MIIIIKKDEIIFIKSKPYSRLVDKIRYHQYSTEIKLKIINEIYSYDFVLK